MVATTTKDITAEKDEIIRDLKEKLHKSFMEMSDMEKIYNDEVEQLKEQYEAKVSGLEAELKESKKRMEDFESPFRQRFSAEFEDFEESFIEPRMKRGSSSFLQEQVFVFL